ncbi:RNA polymerase-associated protein RapA [Neptuniibacter sp. CAU 1671]|uniref:RNA polymerase-associated protein RapA n=1 Tax=Neptuniibacter sp. CAU 1671 TaxID=3032593 RepID=UPI0023DB98EC|nr:RNA polymerase-associated protein RapA [Neptuniibacter sp. CAU 1671]MDF2182844.1 RNA polymerase-associated protein RapA [Neptuniibacter sp. CAU 1671]
MKEKFAVGQRWFSHAEAELGLGIVTEIADRRIEVFFPAIEAQRIYAEKNAPLSRIVYPIGDQITDHDGLTIKVLEHEWVSDCVIYRGEDAQGDILVMHECTLESQVHFSKPYERLFAGQIDKPRHYELRLETLELLFEHQQSAAYGLIGPRVQGLPHQFYIAHEVGRRIAPRVLLADEVGLGKTIEAGLIIHQQLIAGLASRVLIVVPDSLVFQWLVEMLRRFNLRFSLMDEARCEAETGNPFANEQRVIVPLSLLTRNDDLLAQAQAAGWDLLVVDEAHHLGWSEEGASHAYLCIEQLAEQIAGLLLLTATPEQLGVAAHFSRLRLLDPQRYHDLNQFLQEEQQYGAVSQLIERLLEPESCRASLQDPVFAQALAERLGESRLSQLQQSVEDAERLQTEVQQCVKLLLDQHGTGRVLFRNTRDAVHGFPNRVLKAHPLPVPHDYQHHLETAGTDQALHPESLFGEGWVAQDARADWLVKWLQVHRTEKVLLICAYADTAMALEKQLRLYQGVRTALFHEGMSLLERDRAAAYFAETDQGAQILLCSEIGSEGRNFQFAHHLVMFDLPLNPDLLEQRIGRLDRIGQRDDVIIHVPYYERSAQEVLFNWYHQGLNAFERVCPDGQVLLQRFAEPLQQAMQSPKNTELAEQLLHDVQQAHAELKAVMQQGRDKLLELNACDSVKAAEVLEAVESASQPSRLAGYMSRIFDHFGVEQDSYGNHGLVLHPGDHMLCHSFPGVPEEGTTITFQRNEALSREDLQYVTVEHPMVTGAMDMMLQGGYGNATLCTMKLLPLKEGSLLVEALFRLHLPARKGLQLQRYLPAATLRRVIDSNGNDLTQVITQQHFQTLGKPVGKTLGLKLITHTRSEIQTLADKLESWVEPQQAEWIQAACDKATHELDTEIERLQQLARVNPNIRDQEIQDLADLKQHVLHALQSASLEMDTIRIAVVTHD